MSTPHGHARLALARRTAFDLLDTWGVTDADTRAVHLIDALQAAGWGPPREITHGPPRGSYSTDQGRARARALYEQTRDEIRAARLLDSDSQDGDGATSDEHPSARVPASPGTAQGNSAGFHTPESKTL